MDRAEVIEKNRYELQRLHELLASLTDEQLATSLEEGWTVAASLAHVAFWDQRITVLLERFEQQGTGASPFDTDAVNRAALPQWLALPPRLAAELALRAAETVDHKIETISDEMFNWCLNTPDTPIRVTRFKHRGEHIDQIRQAVGK